MMNDSKSWSCIREEFTIFCLQLPNSSNCTWFLNFHQSVSNTIYVDLWWCSGVWFSVWCLITSGAWCSVRRNMPNVTWGTDYSLGEVCKNWWLFVVIIVLLFDICNVINALFDRKIYNLVYGSLGNLHASYVAWWNEMAVLWKQLHASWDSQYQWLLILSWGIIDSILFSYEESNLAVVWVIYMVSFDCWNI